MENSRHIRVLTIRFDEDISAREIPLFRGAVINSMHGNANLLFHNHIGDSKLRYGYPKVQYKRLGGKASIVCVEEGADIIGQFLSEAGGKLMLGEREIRCEINNIKPSRILVQTWEHMFEYNLVRWLPLNSKNYQEYKTIESLSGRISFLEDKLKGNLLSMLKGFKIHLEDELKVVFTQISEPYLVHNKGVRLMAFNVDFKTNLSIPNNLGIGKNASIGFGIVTQIRKEKEKQTDNTESKDK